MPTDLGIRPLYDVDIESAIMMTNMMNGARPGYKIEGITMEIISQYTPLEIPEGNQADEFDHSSWL